MESVKPLRLKREAYKEISKADPLTVVNVWVDSGVSHLDGVYSYRCTSEQKNIIHIGSRLKVPFNSRSCEALVVQVLENQESTEHLKIVESVLGNIPVANRELIEFYVLMAKHWASDPYSLVKFGIPPRVASVEKSFELLNYTETENSSSAKKNVQSSYLMHSPHKSAYVEILDLALERMKKGSTLVLLPDSKDIDRLLNALDAKNVNHDVIRLDSSLSRAQRYENYLKTLAAAFIAQNPQTPQGRVVLQFLVNPSGEFSDFENKNKAKMVLFVEIRHNHSKLNRIFGQASALCALATWC
jgi:primosomal protein N' (replication factor Y)